MKRVFVTIVLLLCACRAEPPATSIPAAMADPVFDHHVHILSPQLVSDWKSLGVPFSRDDEAYTSASRILGEEGEAILVSMAHFYGHPEFRAAFGFPIDVEQKKVRAENDWTEAEARSRDNGTVAFCSVPLLRPYTREELLYCVEELDAQGIKLHLASGGVDLGSEEHLDSIAQIVALAEAREVALLIHVDTQAEEMSEGDIRRFIARVFQPFPEARVMIAHLGGSGGYRERTRLVFRILSEWLAAEPERHVWFDLSGAALEKESEGVPASSEEDLELLLHDLRRFGLERIVFATDYPLTEPNDYLAFLSTEVGLSDEELRAITANRLPLHRGTTD